VHLHILLTVALLTVSVGCASQRFAYTGSVVDSRGRPVPNAHLFISSMDQKEEGIIQGWDADGCGRFSFTFPEKVGRISAWSPDEKREGVLSSPPLTNSVIVIR
jgi:hypothetical protein